MRNIGRYLAVAGLVGYFGACSKDDRKFGGDGNAAGQQSSGGKMSGVTGGSGAKTGGSGGASGAGQLLVVKVPCTLSPECNDANPCNGIEICAAGFCAAEGTNKANGTACEAPAGTVPVAAAGANAGGAAGASQGPTLISPSNDFFCTNGSCVRGYCGDMFVDAAAGEECDDGNTADDDGCRQGCRFTCKTDAECNNGNFCDGTEICLPATHQCATGVAPAEKALCNPEMTKECRQKTCVVIGCGDGAVTTAGEECDDGNVTPNDGCEIDCQWTCESDAECGDKNACNGIETCDKTNPNVPLCRLGKAVTCDDASPCTENLCNPVDGLCVHPLLDGDGDGEASVALGACGKDCNDGDRDIFLSNQEVCKDGKDNDCNPATDDTTSMTNYYLDCDGDGYAWSADAVTECNPPPPKEGLCPPGQANTWTTLRPDAQAHLNWDCNDHDSRARPDQTQYFGDPHLPPPAGDKSWDYDCDGTPYQYYSGGVPTTSACDGWSECSAGYEGVAPQCGGSGTYSYCRAPFLIFYPATSIKTLQRTISPIYYLCDSNAKERTINYSLIQTCR